MARASRRELGAIAPTVRGLFLKWVRNSQWSCQRWRLTFV